MPFVAGLALGRVFRIAPHEAWALLLVVVAIWAVFLFRRQEYALRWINGSVFVVFWVAFGLLWQTLRLDQRNPGYLGNLLARCAAWEVEVDAPPVDNGRTMRVWGTARAARMNGSWKPAKGGILMTFLRDSLRPDLVQGDRLLVLGTPERIARKPDPGGFDVRQWAAGRGVYHQLLVPKENWSRIGPAAAYSGFFISTREKLGDWLRDSGLPERERALVKALVLGQRDELQSDQTEAFVRSGTIHVLAVSGTHVGIIYGILLLSIFWMSKGRHGKIWGGLAVLAGLWAYAGLTGFAPSVLRATIMFSLFTIARMVRWRVSSLNSLASAAFLLLLWDPSTLAQLSFQLSFLAVLGIIVFHDPLMRLWDAPNQVLRFFWGIAAVSLAAQAFTAPLCLYVFRAFPIWFLPANMAIGGLIVVALWGGIALLLFQAVPVLGPILTVLMKWILMLLGAVNDFFAWLPGAYPGIRIGVWGMLGLYLLLAFMAFWSIQRRRWAGHATLATLTVLLCAWAWTARQRNDQKGFAAYALREGFACAFVEGRTLHLFGTGSDEWAWRKVRDHVRFAGIRRVVRYQELPWSIVQRTERYVFFTGDGEEAEGPGWSGQTIALVVGDPGHGATEQADMANAGTWVIGPGLRSAERQRLVRAAARQGMPCHDLRSQGAYVRVR